MYRKNAKTSALSFGKLDKYKYLTGEDLGYRPDPVQKAKFEYSPLGQVFNKGLISGERSEGLFKRLKNIEDKTDNQLRATENNIDNQPPAIKDGINNQPLPIKGQKISDTKKIRDEREFRDAKGNEIKELNYLVHYIHNSIGNISAQTNSTRNGKFVEKNYNFSDYTDLWPLVKKIFEGKLSIKEARKQQNAMQKKITELYNRLKPMGPGKRMNSTGTKTLEDLDSDTKNLYVVREEIINEMSNKDYLKWVEKPELFKNLIQYLSENINAYVNIADRKINFNKLLDDIIDIQTI